MVQRIGDHLQQVEMTLNTTIAFFSSSSPNAFRELEQSLLLSTRLIDLSLQDVLTMKETITNADHRFEKTQTLHFFLNTIKKDLSSKLTEASIEKNSALALASMTIIKYQIAEAKKAHEELIQKMMESA